MYGLIINAYVVKGFTVKLNVKIAYKQIDKFSQRITVKRSTSFDLYAYKGDFYNIRVYLPGHCRFVMLRTRHMSVVVMLSALL